MRRSVTLAVTLLTAVALLASPGARASRTAARDTTPPMLKMGALYGASYSLPDPPKGQTPEERALWVVNSHVAQGHTPREWLAMNDATRLLALPARVAQATGDANTIADGVATIYANLDLPAPDRARTLRDANAIPAAVRGPFADLVRTTARAYALQAPVGKAIAARVAAWTPKAPLITTAERDFMAAIQHQLTLAINVFRARTAAWFAADAPSAPKVSAAGGTDPPLFSDPEGLVVLGGTGNATYTRSGTILDPVLLVEPSGSDRYENSAGGACPATIGIAGRWMDCNMLVLSVVADLGGNDSYYYTGVPAPIQGAGGPGGIGLLVDVAGDDYYYAKMTRGATSYFLTYYFDGGGQGFGYGGNGALIDGLGNDIYRFEVSTSAGRPIWALAQGFGGAGGLGVASDGAGSDQWIGKASGITGEFLGVYTQGVGFYGGVGISTDTGLANDLWYGDAYASGVDYYAQGFGAFGGVGIMADDGGDDEYYSSEQATATKPFIDPLLNCAYGTASYGGVGITLDGAGNDTYYGQSISTKGAEVMDNGFGGPGPAYGVFVDSGGTDRYEMFVSGPGTKMIIGRGLWKPTLTNTFGTFVDVGGTDTYLPASGGGANNSQWTFGVDRGV